jgi:hypothetical protein
LVQLPEPASVSSTRRFCAWPAGVSGAVRFVDSHAIETQRGLRLQAEMFIICVGGTNRRVAVGRRR